MVLQAVEALIAHFGVAQNEREFNDPYVIYNSLSPPSTLTYNKNSPFNQVNSCIEQVMK